MFAKQCHFTKSQRTSSNFYKLFNIIAIVLAFIGSSMYFYRNKLPFIIKDCFYFYCYPLVMVGSDYVSRKYFSSLLSSSLIKKTYKKRNSFENFQSPY